MCYYVGDSYSLHILPSSGEGDAQQVSTQKSTEILELKKNMPSPSNQNQDSLLDLLRYILQCDCKIKYF